MKSLQFAAALLLILIGSTENVAEDLSASGTRPNKVLVLHGKQLFVDNHVIANLDGVRKVLNKPVKHPRNPILRKHKREYAISYGAVVWDQRESLFKLWYQIWSDPQDSIGTAGYAISRDGFEWSRPVTDKATGTNLAIFEPREPWVGAPGVIIDKAETDPQRRFKMMYLAKPTLKGESLRSCAAFSADGIHWRQEPTNPVAPYSDTQIAPFWDARLRRYVAFCRTGPPNIRNIARIESEDFVHWSPKVRVLKRSSLDKPYSTSLYTMTAMPYAGVYIGLVNTYHGETISPIPKDKLWKDRVDAQLVFSRNGVTWQRVLRDGAATAAQLREDRDWKQEVDDAVFIPYGEFQKEWDWGQIYPHHPPMVVGDEIRFYYTGISARHWDTYHKDKPDHAVGLATLRLDGFVSVETDGQGTLTTKPLVFLGDTLKINANAKGGAITVEALDADGQVIDGFGRASCKPISSDSVRHVVSWNGSSDTGRLQGQPITLRFHLRRAKMYSFESATRKQQ
tara:strand:+ start:980 stop:2509 length:1530 start_codon:yes stop_codon:yes gene_type:complete